MSEVGLSDYHRKMLMNIIWRDMNGDTDVINKVLYDSMFVEKSCVLTDKDKIFKQKLIELQKSKSLNEINDFVLNNFVNYKQKVKFNDITTIEPKTDIVIKPNIKPIVKPSNNIEITQKVI